MPLQKRVLAVWHNGDWQAYDSVADAARAIQQLIQQLHAGPSLKVRPIRINIDRALASGSTLTAYGATWVALSGTDSLADIERLVRRVNMVRRLKVTKFDLLSDEQLSRVHELATTP